MAKLVVREGCRYYFGGRDRVGGEEVEVPDAHAEILATRGPLEWPKEKPESPLARTAPKQDEQTSAPKKQQQQRQYRRRDMTAEE